MTEPTTTSTKVQIPSALPKALPVPDVVIGFDGILLLVFLSWLFYKHILYDKIIKHIQDAFRPQAEEDRIKEILPQIGILAAAHRVVFVSFHNGSLDSNGYHLQKITAIHTYLAPGAPAMTKPIRNLPIEKIMYELVELFKSPTGWSTIQKSPDLPPSCRAHLDLNFIYRMHNRLLKIGNLPIGILSIQYTDNLKDPELSDSELISPLMEDLIASLTFILQSRITDPGPFKRILDQIKVFTGV